MVKRSLAPVLMVQGTASHVGKSILTTALCRIFRQKGLRVAPFKAQNMALNSFVAVEGGEIGRAQAVQAEAAGIEASIDMNPILLKPEGDARAQVVVNGRSTGSMAAADYYRTKSSLWPVVVEALTRLRARVDLVVAEGAGSPAEINLRHADLANMRVALHTRAPVLLVGDIERGGVFAALVGTLALLEPEERALVCGLAINKFRGDPAILDSGLSLLEQRTGVPVLGVIPYLHDLDLPEEDSLALDGRGAPAEAGTLDVVVVRLPRIANFDDFGPLAAEPSVSVRYADQVGHVGQPDLIILPGTKTTLPDLAWLRQTGLAGQITALAARGTPILGICGGFQMLGERILDPTRSESAETEADGLGLLSVRTTFATTKQTCRVRGSVIAARGPFAAAAGAAIAGYEIHMGQTELLEAASPLFTISERSNLATEDRDGLVSPNGLVLGSYLHGLFDTDMVRQALVGWLLERKGERPAPAFKAVDRARQYDDLADAVRRSLDVRQLEVACKLA